ncbi:MAG: protein kinase [Chloroflexi bacterium]|nr:protein kinase [Chloroflexota bacterium]
MAERSIAERLIGAALGHYRLQQLIDQGKWGPTFLASARNGATYVLRFIGTPSLDTQPDKTPDARIVFLGLFQQEANHIAALEHPHILPLLDYGNYQGMPYLVYPHVSLTPLRTILAQKESTDLLSVGRYLQQIASTLEYAHERAILHRNLSTNCIFLQANRQLVVAEFGLMRIHELSRQSLSPADAQISRGNSYDGSSESSAPEQLLGKQIDAYTDIYALGAVLYRMLTGHAPFTGKTREEIARQHLYAQLPPISTWRKGLPVDLDHIISKAMAKEPLQRFHRPDALVNAYYRIVAPNEKPPVPLVAPEPLPSPRPYSTEKSLSVPREKAVKGAQMSRAAAVKQPPMSRRTFVLVGAGGGVAVLAGAAYLGMHALHGATVPGATAASTQAATQGTSATNAKVASTQAATQGVQQGGNVLARVADLPLNTAKTFPIANQKNPGVLVHLSNNHFVAYDTTCTHAACEVAYNPQSKLLDCPCHGAIFDPANNGAVVQGPAQTPLTAIKIVVNANGTITAA